jgi:excinuclease ABC subunit B
MSSAARLRDEVKRLEAVELAVIDDPTVRQSNIKHATASWPQLKGDRKASSTAGKPGSRAYRGKKR